MPPVRHQSRKPKGNVKHSGLSLCKPEPLNRHGLGSPKGLLYCWLYRNNSNSSRLGKILSPAAPRKTWLLWGQIKCQVFLPAGHGKRWKEEEVKDTITSNSCILEAEGVWALLAWSGEEGPRTSLRGNEPKHCFPWNTLLSLSRAMLRMGQRAHWCSEFGLDFRAGEAGPPQLSRVLPWGWIRSKCCRGSGRRGEERSNTSLAKLPSLQQSVLLSQR